MSLSFPKTWNLSPSHESNSSISNSTTTSVTPAGTANVLNTPCCPPVPPKRPSALVKEPLFSVVLMFQPFAPESKFRCTAARWAGDVGGYLQIKVARDQAIGGDVLDFKILACRTHSPWPTSRPADSFAPAGNPDTLTSTPSAGRSFPIFKDSGIDCPAVISTLAGSTLQRG
jgi:hypothetical protein